MKKYLIFLILISVAALFGSRFSNASQPSDFGLKEGDLISAIFSDDPDVYIVNEHGYKRLFLNPDIFQFYTHLGGFFNVKLVTKEVIDLFPTSGLFRDCESNDQKVYGVDIEGEDTGQLHWVNTTGDQAVKDDSDFFKKVFCINKKEFDWYPKAISFNSVTEVPKYDRIIETTTVSTQERLEAKAETKSIGKVIICHYPPENIQAYQTLTIDASALKAHLDHGDTVGSCLSPTPISTPLTSSIPTVTPIVSISPSPSVSASFSPTPAPTFTVTPIPTTIATPSPTASQSSSPTPTLTPTPTPSVLSITSVSPISGPNGTVITLIGTGFYPSNTPSSYQATLCFLLSPSGCANAYTTPTSDTQIQFTVPSSTYLSAKTYKLFLQIYGSASSPTQTFMVTTPITTDTTPPSAPTNFTATAVSASPFSYGYIELSWLGSTDSGSTDTSASGYKVYRGGNVISEIGSVRTLTNANTINFTASEGYLQPATTYTYFVVAYDAAGNVSAPSNSASATTLSTSTPTPTPVTSSVNFNNFSRNLAMGSIGNDVKQLQALLANEVGYSANLITGYFGRITRDAVKRLQEKYGVKPVSGYFGEITRKTLIKN